MPWMKHRGSGEWRYIPPEQATGAYVSGEWGVPTGEQFAVELAGNRGVIPSEEFGRVVEEGGRLLSREELAKEQERERYSGVGPAAAAAGLGALDALTFGTGSAVAAELVGKQPIRALKEHQPAAGFVGEAVTGLAAAGPALARLGARAVAKTAAKEVGEAAAQAAPAAVAREPLRLPAGNPPRPPGLPPPQQQLRLPPGAPPQQPVPMPGQPGFFGQAAGPAIPFGAADDLTRSVSTRVAANEARAAEMAAFEARVQGRPVGPGQPLPVPRAGVGPPAALPPPPGAGLAALPGGPRLGLPMPPATGPVAVGAAPRPPSDVPALPGPSQWATTGGRFGERPPVYEEFAFPPSKGPPPPPPPGGVPVGEPYYPGGLGGPLIPRPQTGLGPAGVPGLDDFIDVEAIKKEVRLRTADDYAEELAAKAPAPTADDVVEMAQGLPPKPLQEVLARGYPDAVQEAIKAAQVGGAYGIGSEWAEQFIFDEPSDPERILASGLLLGAVGGGLGFASAARAGSRLMARESAASVDEMRAALEKYTATKDVGIVGGLRDPEIRTARKIVQGATLEELAPLMVDPGAAGTKKVLQRLSVDDLLRDTFLTKVARIVTRDKAVHKGVQIQTQRGRLGASIRRMSMTPESEATDVWARTAEMFDDFDSAVKEGFDAFNVVRAEKLNPILRERPMATVQKSAGAAIRDIEKGLAAALADRGKYLRQNDVRSASAIIHKLRDDLGLLPQVDKEATKELRSRMADLAKQADLDPAALRDLKALRAAVEEANEQTRAKLNAWGLDAKLSPDEIYLPLKDPTPDQVYWALHKARQDMDMLGAPHKTFRSAKGDKFVRQDLTPQEQNTVLLMQANAKQLRKLLVDDATWGPAAAEAARFNEGWSLYDRTRKAMLNVFGPAKATKLGGGDPKKFLDMFRDPSDPKRWSKMTVLAKHLEAVEMLASAMGGRANISEVVAKFNRELQGAARLSHMKNSLLDVEKKSRAFMGAISNFMIGAGYRTPISMLGRTLLFAADPTGSALSFNIAVLRGMDAARNAYFAAISSGARAIAKPRKGTAIAAIPALEEALSQPFIEREYSAPPKDEREAFERRRGEVLEVLNRPQTIREQMLSRLGVAAEVAPGVSGAMADHAERIANHLAERLPLDPNLPGVPTPMQVPYDPSRSEIARWARHFRAAVDPLSVLDEIAAGTLSPEAAETVRELYPGALTDMAEAIRIAIEEAEEPPSREVRASLGLLFGASMVQSYGGMSALQAMHARQQGGEKASGGTAGAGKVESVPLYRAETERLRVPGGG